MKRFGNVILKKWYWFLFAAVVLGEAAVFLFSGRAVISLHMITWICLWDTSRR